MSKENQIELNLIEQLKGLKYIHRPDIVDRKTLEQNFKAKFEELNRVNLTDNEFLRLREEIINSEFEKCKSDVLTIGIGMLAMSIGAKLMDKMITIGMSQEERKKHRRKRAARRWSRYSVKRWKATR